jgi:hypothetical protein
MSQTEDDDDALQLVWTGPADEADLHHVLGGTHVHLVNFTDAHYLLVVLCSILVLIKLIKLNRLCDIQEVHAVTTILFWYVSLQETRASPTA